MSRREAALRYLLILGLVMVLSPAGAEIYRWVDGEGNVHFGDAPPRTAGAERLEPKVNRYRPRVPVPSSSAAEIPGKAPRVVMYSTRWCGYCKQARRYFRDNGIRFTEHDIERSSSARSAYDRLGGRGVPLILVGDQRMNGFSAERFRMLYDRQASHSTSR